MVQVDGLDTLAEQAAALETALGGAVTMAAAFDTELGQMRESMVFTGREVNTPCAEPPALALSARMPPTSAVISGTVSVSMFARSTSATAGDTPAVPV